MAFVVLFSTMSFTVDMHYCGDTLVDTAVFSKAHTCGMEMQNSTTKECSITKKSCCNDEQIAIDGQDDLKNSFDKLSLEKKLLITSFVYIYLNLFEALNEDITSFRDYAHSLFVKQIFKLDESYLI